MVDSVEGEAVRQYPYCSAAMQHLQLTPPPACMSVCLPACLLVHRWPLLISLTAADAAEMIATGEVDA